MSRDPTLPRRRCSLIEGIRIERGMREDWLALAPLHYRSHEAGAVTDIFRVVYEKHLGFRNSAFGLNGSEAPIPGDVAPSANPQSAIRNPQCLVGVIVYSRSPLSLGGRDRATGGRYRLGGLGRLAMGRLINEELRIISRVVLAPNWRGLGLASRLVAETLPQAGTPYVEAMAAMGAMHPFFERAGMTAYPPPPSPQGERLRAALETVEIGRVARRSAESLAEALEALDPAARSLAEREVERWCRSYLGAKNHRTNRPDRRRRLELVARHLDSAPVYYLWRSVEKMP